MNSEIKFSVLMSVYEKDNPAFFKEALDSVIDQTRRPNEIVVAVDGHLQSRTKEILQYYAKKYDFIKNIFLPTNAGRGEALKKTIPLCKYDLIALADADDINLPCRFEKLLECFAQNPDLSVAGGQIKEVDAASLIFISYRKVPLFNNEIREYLKKRSPINQPTVMFKKKDIVEAGSYRKFHLLEDYDLWARIAAKNLKMQNIPETLVLCRADKNLYKRRGGWKYFKSNKALQDELLELKLISFAGYAANVIIRFIVQVLMPNSLRCAFYKTFLRLR